MKSAIIHDWIAASGGAENVLEEIYSCFPSSVYTLFCKKNCPFPTVYTSFLQKLPKITAWYRWMLPFFPLAVEQFDLRDYNLIISSSHCVAKGILTSPQQIHICYCHTPMRYIWDLSFFYLKNMNPVEKFFAKMFFSYLRSWDFISSNRVTHFVANSHFVAKRIKHYYRRDAKVIYPPVDTGPFSLKPKENYYVVLSRLVPHKKVDVVVRAFKAMPEKKLIIIGEGPEMRKLQDMASGNIEFLGYISKEAVREYVGKALGLIHAAEEDFGISIVEAMALGTPVLAFGKGGALETVAATTTGLFFPSQSPESLIKTMKDFEKIDWDYQKIQNHAKIFDKKIFKTEFSKFVNQCFTESANARKL